MVIKHGIAVVAAGLLPVLSFGFGGTVLAQTQSRTPTPPCQMRQSAPAAPGKGGGRGRMGCGMGMGMGMGAGMADMQTIHTLFARSGTITRTVKILTNGIEAVTESSDPEVAKMLREHVMAMKTRLERKEPIRQGDPLFAAIFENADKIKVSVTPTARGVKVVETSDDPYTVKLLHGHAQAVSGFVRDGMAGMHTFHPAPPK